MLTSRERLKKLEIEREAIERELHAQVKENFRYFVAGFCASCEAWNGEGEGMLDAFKFAFKDVSLAMFPDTSRDPHPALLRTLADLFHDINRKRNQPKKEPTKTDEPCEGTGDCCCPRCLRF